MKYVRVREKERESVRVCFHGHMSLIQWNEKAGVR